MNRIAIVIALVATLAACALYPPGRDPNGQALLQSANTVLAAANRFADARGANPGSLQALVPEFISALPTEPQLAYNPAKGTFSFAYSPTLSSGRCICTASIGSSEFACNACYQ